MTFWRFGLPLAIGGWLGVLIALVFNITPSLTWAFITTGVALGCILYDHFFGEKSDDVGR